MSDRQKLVELLNEHIKAGDAAEWFGTLTLDEQQILAPILRECMQNIATFFREMTTPLIKWYEALTRETRSALEALSEEGGDEDLAPSELG